MCLFLRIQISPFFLSLFFGVFPFCTQFCTNANRCFCDMGWGGPDCSTVVLLTTPMPTEALPTPENTIKMEKKETPYGKRGDSGALLAIPRRSCRVAVFTGISLSLSLCLTREKSKSNRIRLYSTERNVTLINLANPACYGGATVTVTVKEKKKKQ